jgi:hypothetical protein
LLRQDRNGGTTSLVATRRGQHAARCWVSMERTRTPGAVHVIDSSSIALGSAVYAYVDPPAVVEPVP